MCDSVWYVWCDSVWCDSEHVQDSLGVCVCVLTLKHLVSWFQPVALVNEVLYSSFNPQEEQ